MPTILALDVGETRIGVAVGSSESGLARPHSVFRHSTRENDARRIRELLAESGATLLLVGLPLNADGSSTAQAERIRRYAAGLADMLPVPVAFWNEAFSSQVAQERLLAGGSSRKRRRQREDATAAAVMLQDYLHSLR
ncbi:MAG: Holliday junction resolvase RuvX [Anaerolineae bacterium]